LYRPYDVPASRRDTTVSIDDPDPGGCGIRVTMSDNDDALQNAAQECLLFGDNAMKELGKREGNFVTTSFKAKVSAAPYEEANRGHITGKCVAHAEQAFTKHTRKKGIPPKTELYKYNQLRGDLGKLARFPLGYEQVVHARPTADDPPPIGGHHRPPSPPPPHRHRHRGCRMPVGPKLNGAHPGSLAGRRVRGALVIGAW
jgi:hypothetical protein